MGGGWESGGGLGMVWWQLEMSVWNGLVSCNCNHACIGMFWTLWVSKTWYINKDTMLSFTT